MSRVPPPMPMPPRMPASTPTTIYQIFIRFDSFQKTAVFDGFYTLLSKKQQFYAGSQHDQSEQHRHKIV